MSIDNALDHAKQPSSPFITASFNPQNPNEFLVACQQKLTFYSITKSYKHSQGEEEQDIIDECERTNIVDFNPGPGESYLDVIWDAYSNIYVSTD